MPGGIISDYEYDAAGRLTSLTHYAPRDAGDDEDTGPITDNEILGQYVYLLREDGRRIAAIEKHDAGTSPDNSDLITTRWAWSYDGMGRLTHEAYDSPGSDYVHTYTFDAAGNRESWLKETDPAFGSTGTGFLTFDVQSFAAEVTVTYDYDANDRLLTETLDAPGAADDRHTVSDWDGGGSTMQLGKVVYDTLDDTGDVVREESFTYSARGRMAGAEIDADGAGSSSAAETTTEYSYDDSGFRIRQSTTHDSTTVVTEFVADANNATGYTQTIEEHSREGTPTTRQVSYTIGLDEIVQAVKDNPAATAVVSQFLHDGRGSVRQLADALAELVQAATKDAAAVLKLDYSAYGTAVNYAAEAVATALLHNGEFVDPVTGQQYLRARWYDQSTGRFNRVDPFAGEASVPQSLHKYLFAHGDAVTHSDPSGEFRISLVGGILIGGLIVLTALTWLYVQNQAAITRMIAGVTPVAISPYQGNPPAIQWGSNRAGQTGFVPGPNKSVTVTVPGGGISFVPNDPTATAYNLLVTVRHKRGAKYITAAAFATVRERLDDGAYGLQSSLSPRAPFFNDQDIYPTRPGQRIFLSFGDAPGFTGTGSMYFRVHVVQSLGLNVGTVYGAYDFIVHYKSGAVTTIINIGPVPVSSIPSSTPR